MKKYRTLSMFLIAAAGVLAFPGGAQSETLVEQNFETRVVLSLKVKAAELQKFLSGPWEVAAIPAGPFKGANFSIVFYDQELRQDASGKTDAPPRALRRIYCLREVEGHRRNDLRRYSDVHP